MIVPSSWCSYWEGAWALRERERSGFSSGSSRCLKLFWNVFMNCIGEVLVGAREGAAVFCLGFFDCVFGLFLGGTTLHGLSDCSALFS